jgi:hypothetical protein
MGPRYPRALWYSVHSPEEAEPLPPYAQFKYAYGHCIEALAIALAKAAGHEVTGEQDELSVDGVTGHRDCVIDGYVVDVKSTSSFSFKNLFKGKGLENNDSFGYLDQLDSYMVGSANDPLVRYKDIAYDWAIDKQLGHMVLYEHHLRRDYIIKRVAECKDIAALSTPPRCTCQSVKDGESGNYKLDTKASYNSYKYVCNPSLRTFIYADGPRYLTKMVRRPAAHVIEVDRYGNFIHG